MQRAMTISVTKVSAFFNNFEFHHVSKEEIMEYAGIPQRTFDSPDNRLTGKEVHKILETAVRVTNDENIGLHQGEHMARGFSNILGYVLMNCRTIKEGWMKYCRYEKIVDETGCSGFVIEDDRAIFSNNTIDSVLKDNRQFSDFKIAGMLSYIMLLTDKRLPLLEVCFTHPAPKDTSEYKRIFQCKVLFDQPINALVFDKRFLDISIVQPNEELLALFEKKAQEILNKLENRSTLTRKVAEIILRDMKGGLPSIEVVAKELAVSVRSLQLYLKDEGTSYMEVVNEIRKNAAEKYLGDRDTSIDEIAYLLGFSEASTFHKAFKRWTRLTPGQFRKLVVK